MSDERERVEHPSWCDRDACTAPEFRPTSEEYKGGAAGSHYSSTMGSRTNDLQIFLAQSVCPWDTEAYLIVRNGEDGIPQTVPMSESGGGFALYELLGKEVEEQVRKYPALYAERFLRLHAAIEDEADEATADASMPRDPVELQDQMTAEFLADEEAEERAAKGCTHPPEEPCFGRVTTTSSAEETTPTQDVGEDR
jgi:hypothetical protein